MYGMLRTVSHMIKVGDLTVTDSDGAANQYGDKTGEPVHMRFNTRHAERAVAFDPELKLAECFMDGEIDFLNGDIYTLLKIVFENTGPTAATEPWMKAAGKFRVLFRRFQQMNNLARSSSNVKSHYDLSGALYDLFLDPDKQYSCAYFETPKATLAEAQLAKKRHIAAKLLVNEDDKILDIGCGWGGMGLYLARYLKANVTGVTLSEEQHAIANKRAVEEGLADRAKFQLTDYRNIDDQFDRLVSVGMFEHVGVGHFAEYFQHAARLLKKTAFFCFMQSAARTAPAPPIRSSANIFSPAAIFRRFPKYCHISKSRTLCHRHRNPTASLCGNAQRMAACLHGPARGSQGTL